MFYTNFLFESCYYCSASDVSHGLWRAIFEWKKVPVKSLLHSVELGLQGKKRRLSLSEKNTRVATITHEQKQSKKALDSGLLLQAAW